MDNQLTMVKRINQLQRPLVDSRYFKCNEYTQDNFVSKYQSLQNVNGIPIGIGTGWIFQANNVRSDEAKPKKVKKKKPKIEPSLDEQPVQEPVEPVAVTLEEPEEPLMLVDQVS